MEMMERAQFENSSLLLTNLKVFAAKVHAVLAEMKAQSTEA